MRSRKCEQCKHFIIAKAGEGKIYGCDRSKCVFEPTTKNNLGVQMTNGEKIISAFPNGEVRKCGKGVVFSTGGWCHAYADEWWNAECEEPTTKNDLAQERYQDLIEYFGDEEVAKTILEDRKEFKAWLERAKWHVKRADELARRLEQIKETTKNDLGVDTDKLIADCEKMSFDSELFDRPIKVVALDAVKNIVKRMPSVTPQEPRKGHWIRVTDKTGHLVWECDKCGWQQRFNTNYCPDCGAQLEEVEE